MAQCFQGEAAMKGELCRAFTADGLELQGLFAVPDDGPAQVSIIHVHGLAGNFYENRFIDRVGDAVTGKGFNFLTVNTRGRDYISDFIYQSGGSVESIQIGAIHETFEESVHDIAAWMDFLASRGSDRVILQGHSHGALKVTYYVHKTGDSRAVGLILLSPSDDFGCQRARIGDRFDEALRIAADMRAEGRGRELMPEGYFHYPTSAATYFDIFCEDSKLKMFNLARTDRSGFPELADISLTVLMIVGSVDEAFMGSPQRYVLDVRGEMKKATDFTGHIVEGAPHNYLGHEEEVAKTVEAWLVTHKEWQR
jgi:pimeloyl-ACP methyl ester carboxylesterase